MDKDKPTANKKVVLFISGLSQFFVGTIIKKIIFPVQAALICLLAFAPPAYTATANISGERITHTPLIVAQESNAVFNLSLFGINPTNTVKIDVSFTNVNIRAGGITGTITEYFNPEVSGEVVIFTQKDNIVSTFTTLRNLSVNIPITANGPSSATNNINGFNVNIAGAEISTQASAFTYAFPIIVANNVMTFSSTSTAIEALQANSVASDTLIFDVNMMGTTTIKVGDTLVFDITSKTPYGLLRKVTNVVESGNSIEVSTQQARLTDVFEQAFISYNEKLDLSAQSAQFISNNQQSKIMTPELEMDGMQQFSSDMGTVRIYDKNIALQMAEFVGCTTDGIDKVYSLDLQIPVPTPTSASDINSTISIFGCIGFSLTPDFKIDIRSFTLKGATFTLTPIISQELGVRASSELSISKETTIRTILLRPVTIIVPVLSAPIVIVPVVKIKIGIDGKVSASLEAGAVSELSSTFGFLHDGKNWQSVAKRNTEFDYLQPTVKADAQASVYAGPTLEMLIYKLAGPELSLQGFVAIKADFMPTPPLPCWVITAGLRLGGAVKVKVLGYNIADYSNPDILSFDKKLAESYCLEIKSEAITTAKVGEQYQYIITTNAPATANIIFSTTGKPNWLILTSHGSQATLTGTPANNDIGKGTITIFARSIDTNEESSQTFNLTVLGFRITSEPITTSSVGISYFYNIITNAPATANIQFNITGNPSWLILTESGTATTLSGTPTINDIGQSIIAITVQNIDTNEEASQTFALNTSLEGTWLNTEIAIFESHKGTCDIGVAFEYSVFIRASIINGNVLVVCAFGNNSSTCAASDNFTSITYSRAQDGGITKGALSFDLNAEHIRGRWTWKGPVADIDKDGNTIIGTCTGTDNAVRQ